MMYWCVLVRDGIACPAKSTHTHTNGYNPLDCAHFNRCMIAAERGRYLLYEPICCCIAQLLLTMVSSEDQEIVFCASMPCQCYHAGICCCVPIKDCRTFQVLCCCAAIYRICIHVCVCARCRTVRHAGTRAVLWYQDVACYSVAYRIYTHNSVHSMDN